MKLLLEIEKKMISLTPIGDEMHYLKTQNLDISKKNEIKQRMKRKLSPEIIGILQFLISEDAKQDQSLSDSIGHMSASLRIGSK